LSFGGANRKKGPFSPKVDPSRSHRDPRPRAPNRSAPILRRSHRRTNWGVETQKREAELRLALVAQTISSVRSLGLHSRSPSRETRPPAQSAEAEKEWGLAARRVMLWLLANTARAHLRISTC